MVSDKRIIDVIVFVFVCLSATRKSVAEKNYYLDRSVKSVSYKLNFDPNFKEKKFKLKTEWIFNITKSQNYVSVHQVKLKSLKCFLYDNITNELDRRAIVRRHNDNNMHKSGEESSNIMKLYYPKKNEEFKIQTYGMSFPRCVGSLQNNMEGFYFDEYFDEDYKLIPYLTTQFGPIGSRYAFPCADEPYFRAKFEITITRPHDYTCITNAKLKKSTPMGNFVKDEFESTEPISPSSVAFTISKMQISPEQDGSIHRIVARPEVLKAKNYEGILQEINKAYELIEKFFQCGCELKELYHVTLPSNKMKFDSLGTYWGINHYTENMLIHTKETSAEDIEIAMIEINKLLAQQWFLSYLMVDKWTWAWVNDGLTMYVSYNVSNQIYPDWFLYERLQNYIRLAMKDDSKCCWHALNKEVRTPSEIKAKINHVNVYKGTAMFIMMERIIPPLAFTQSIKTLITDKKWSTYNSNDLYQRVEKIMDLHNMYEMSNLPMKFTEIMSIWESLSAYPVITVIRNYDTDYMETVNLMQNRFYYDEKQPNDVWPIPINYVIENNKNFNNTRPTSWMVENTGKLVIETLDKADWLILNIQATYYYRVNYDPQNWFLLIRALKEHHETIHVLNRMQLIDDAFTLAEFGELDYSIALELAKYIKKERDYGPLKSMHSVYELTIKKLFGTKAYNLFKMSIKTSIEYNFDHFIMVIRNKTSREPETYHKYQHIIQLLFSWLCDLESSRCDTKNVSDILDLLQSSNLETQELRNNMKNAKEKEWDEFFEKYESEKNQLSIIKMGSVIGAFASPFIAGRFLKAAIKLGGFTLIPAVKQMVSMGKWAVDIVLNSSGPILEALLKIFDEDQIMDVFNMIGSSITTGDQLNIFTKFASRFKKYFRLFEKALANARQNLKWRKANLRSFTRYYQSGGTNHLNNVHAIFLIVPYYIKLILY